MHTEFKSSFLLSSLTVPLSLSQLNLSYKQSFCPPTSSSWFSACIKCDLPSHLLLHFHSSFLLALSRKISCFTSVNDYISYVTIQGFKTWNDSMLSMNTYLPQQRHWSIVKFYSNVCTLELRNNISRTDQILDSLWSTLWLQSELSTKYISSGW
jgi:hypothetical protein